jgi:hypothetical protein
LQGRLTSVALTATGTGNLRTLTELGDFWKIPYHTGFNGETDCVLVSSGIPHEKINDDVPVVLFPAQPEDFQAIGKMYDLRITERQLTVRLPVGPGTSTAIRTTVTEFQGSNSEPLLRTDGVTLLTRVRETNTNLASLDIVGEYNRRIYEGLEDDPSSVFRLASRMPVPYSLLPAAFRNWSLRRAGHAREPNEAIIGPVECLRTLFLASIVLASRGPVPRIGFWESGVRYVASITHDTESRRGLEEGARGILEVEKKFGVRSTWNLPSDRYPLTKTILRDLAKEGDIGAHDTRHDGKLILLSLRDKTIRATQCRQKLELAADAPVFGFRAPLLQHSRELLTAVHEAGYDFDSSVPSWEPVSPTSQKPHGIGTVFPLQIDALVEIPVSLPQDHQFLRIMQRSPKETVDELLRLTAWIRSIGGACIVLVHPDYEFGQLEHQAEYARLLEEFRKDAECKIMTMSEISHWWRLRSDAFVDISNGEARIVSGRRGPAADTLDLQILTGYGDNGFEIKSEC